MIGDRISKPSYPTTIICNTTTIYVNINDIFIFPDQHEELDKSDMKL